MENTMPLLTQGKETVRYTHVTTVTHCDYCNNPQCLSLDVVKWHQFNYRVDYTSFKNPPRSLNNVIADIFLN